MLPGECVSLCLRLHADQRATSCQGSRVTHQGDELHKQVYPLFSVLAKLDDQACLSTDLEFMQWS